MIGDSDFLVIGFLALGGVVALLPAVLLGKLKVSGIAKGIGVFVLIVICSASFYLSVTDANLLEILSLKANSPALPKRIFSVSYTMIIVLLVLLPVAAIKVAFGNKGENA